MNPHLTKLQDFLSQLTPRNDITKERNAAIDALITYIEALYGPLKKSEESQLQGLLYQFFKSIEAELGLD